MARPEELPLDRELADLSPDRRWREWMLRVEAVLFASSTPVAREVLARVVGSSASVDLLIEDLRTDLQDRPYDVARVGQGWWLRTRTGYASAIRAAAGTGHQTLGLGEFDLAVLAAIAWNQPISRDGLTRIFGRQVSRDVIGRLSDRGLIAAGPREPRRGAPGSFVTTDGFLAAFNLRSLRDLPDPEDRTDDGWSDP